MGIFRIPEPKNEPVYGYAPGSPERAKLQDALKKLKSKQIDVPLIINGKEVRPGSKIKMTSPHDHNLVLGYTYKGTKKDIESAIDGCLKAQATWQDMPLQHRAAIFLKAADLLAGPYRYIMNAATMLAHSKSIFQAEIDAVCELVDFWRYNAYYMQEIAAMQPTNPDPLIWNRMDYRPLEGFIFAVTPFNFVSINGNLPTAPAMWGNVALWKPASSVMYTSHFIMKILMEAGLPAGVINMVSGKSSEISDIVFNHSKLAGVHFTGSTGVFQSFWKTIGENIAKDKYKSYPRIVGETGGKDFVFVHKSANVEQVATAITRGAFEYQGQKCSAASRAYIPKSMWPKLEKLLLADIKAIKMGDPADFTNFMNAVIDESAFKSITAYIDFAKKAKDAKIIAGGGYDDSKGYFIEPTIILTTNPKFKTIEEEIFGPVMTIYVYADKDYEKTLHLCDETSPYALTGAVFGTDRDAVVLAERVLRQAAGNFYINDKPTGAVVGQQPFGGARASGTNDKAGSYLNMIRWTSPRTIKENFTPPTDFRYPFMAE